MNKEFSENGQQRADRRFAYPQRAFIAQSGNSKAFPIFPSERTPFSVTIYPTTGLLVETDFVSCSTSDEHPILQRMSQKTVTAREAKQ